MARVAHADTIIEARVVAVRRPSGRSRRYAERLGLLAILFLATTAVGATADTVYKQAADGKEQICARDVIVYYHYEERAQYWYLKGNLVLSNTCSADRLGEPLHVVRSSNEEKRLLIQRWFALGHTADVTDASGALHTVHNLGLDFDPRPGYRLICPSGCFPGTSITLQTGSRESIVDFAKIDAIQTQGPALTIVLKDGGRLAGPVISPRSYGGIAVLKGVVAHGIDDLGSFELPLTELRSVIFKRPPK